MRIATWNVEWLTHKKKLDKRLSDHKGIIVEIRKNDIGILMQGYFGRKMNAKEKTQVYLVEKINKDIFQKFLTRMNKETII